MMRVWICGLGVVLFFLIGGSSPALDAPLSYTAERASHHQEAELAVSALRLAPFDLLAPDAAPAPVEMELGAKSILASGWKYYENDSKPATVGGRECRKGSFTFTLDDPKAPNSRGDLYLLIDYFDDAPPDHVLRVSYPADAGGQIMVGCKLEPLEFTNTKTWKRCQFKLTRARLGEKHENNYVLGISIRSTHRDTQPPSGGRATLDVSASLPKPSPGESAPPATVKLPDALTTAPVFASATLGDQKMLFVLDRQTSSDTCLNRLYIDRNQNGDFSDESPHDIKPYVSASRTYWSARFPGIGTTYTLAGKALPYRFLLQAFQETPFNAAGTDPVTSGLSVFLNSECCYRGEFDLEGKRYRVALGDSDGNGRFGDQVTSCIRTWMWGSNECDMLNGDLLYLSSRGGFHFDSGARLGQWLSLGGKLYEARVLDGAPAILRLTPFTGKTARLKLPCETEMLQLTGADRKRMVTVIESSGAEIDVPEGEWVAGNYLIERADEAGARWYVLSLGSSKAKPFAAQAGKLTEVRYGEPYRLMVSVPESSRKKVQAGGKEASLEMSVLGAADETVLRTWYMYGGPPTIAMSQDRVQQSKEPAYRIIKPDGEVAAEGAFEYG